MTIFFLVATAIYGALHAFIWWKTTRQLGLRGPAALALALFFALMVVAPFLGRLLRGGAPLLSAAELATFLWMGISFYLAMLNLSADLWNLAAALTRVVSPGAHLPLLGGPRLFYGIAATTAAIVAWGTLEAANVGIRRIVVPTAKLAPGAAPLRVVQVSDIHLGLLIGKRRLGTILERVREARPDLLVATGDMLDAVGDHLEPLMLMWRGIAPRLGKVAVTGNHEYYTGIPGALAFLDGAGFRVLRDETLVLPGLANLIGKEYRAPGGLPGSPLRRRPLADLIGDGDPALFTLLLNHLPIDFDEEAAPLGVDLQLSGHTHDGQMFPFRWLVRLSFRHVAGPYRRGGSLLYVSRGTGTWGPPLRFLAPPEVTLFEIVAASEKGPAGALHSSRLPAAGTSPPQHPLVARLASEPF
jgi:predicted MPP superfamily phosphohydrolase